MRLRAALLVVLLATSSCGGSVSQTAAPTAGAVPRGAITVFAASSLTQVLDRVAEELARVYPGTTYTLNYGSSSTLATQIANGAPADVFASADEVNMQKVLAAGLADHSASTFATNRLQIAVAPGNPERLSSLADLGRRDLIVVLAAPSVPAGRYARESLGKAGVTLTTASQEVDVRAVLNKVALGEADAGIVYVTDVRSAGSRVAGVDIAEQHQVIARYPVVALKESRNPRLSERFIDFLLSSSGQRLFGEFGFTPP